MWDYSGITIPTPYGTDTRSYEKAMGFLDESRCLIEDWGCGTAFAKQFVKKGIYWGIDFTPSRFCDVVADLATRLYDHKLPDCILLRHVLEHNYNWRDILRNAARICRWRMVIVLFTPLQAEGDKVLGMSWDTVPDLGLQQTAFEEILKDFTLQWEEYDSELPYGREWVIYAERT